MENPKSINKEQINDAIEKGEASPLPAYAIEEGGVALDAMRKIFLELPLNELEKMGKRLNEIEKGLIELIEDNNNDFDQLRSLLKSQEKSLSRIFGVLGCFVLDFVISGSTAATLSLSRDMDSQNGKEKELLLRGELLEMRKTEIHERMARLNKLIKSLHL